MITNFQEKAHTRITLKQPSTTFLYSLPEVENHRLWPTESQRTLKYQISMREKKHYVNLQNSCATKTTGDIADCRYLPGSVLHNYRLIGFS